MIDKLDCIVIGAGVVGLAIARALAIAGRDVVVLESEQHIGLHTSSRNSEVIHAGIYYPEGSLKARLCIRGNEMLYRFCDEHRVANKRTGKLIVAVTDNERHRLFRTQEQAKLNGVHDLRLVSADEVREMEPAVECSSALLSPSTGIIDSHAFMLALQADIENKGGVVVCDSEVTSVAARKEGFCLTIKATNDRFACNVLINSAGHAAHSIARAIGGTNMDSIPHLHLAKGHYFAYQGRSPFNHLIYPLPTGGGLGIHATNDLGGVARFGPDVSWIDSVDYDFDESRKPIFVAAIRQYFPKLDEAKLVPAYTGVRPKLHGHGEPNADFVIQSEADHGVRGLVNLFGIESPGLTASLAIGEYIIRFLHAEQSKNSS